jgi:RNA polymerase sigma-54 factor
MALEQKLHLKLAQKLVMTPTLQQAIKLLQLSRLELEQALSQELQVNPVLELSEDAPVDDEVAVPEEEGDDGGQSAQPPDDGDLSIPAEAGAERGDTEPAADETPSEASYGEVELEALFANYLHDTARAAATWEDEEEPPLENSPAPEASMFDSLVEQLHLDESPLELRLACEYVIGNLDPDGYLRTSNEDLAAQLGVDTATIELAVAAVQRLDPPGIAARTVNECLTLQLDRYAWPVDPDALRLTRRLVVEAFDDLLHQRWERITQRYGIDRETIRQVLEIVRRLNPRPGSQLGPNDNPAVEPDVVVTKVAGVWRVSLNDEGFPRLRLSGQYVRLLQSRTMDSETNGYLRERMRAALWFLRSVEQRQSTIMKVSEAIVRRQEEFLERGLPHLRPLVLRDIADDIGMHESTVSRVVANKYMATPRGVFPLKFFFHSSISHAVQGDISSLVVKERIRALIAEEEPRRPLSDARVARQLNRLGIRIARRTVAKYREELGIPSSEQRRRVLR